MVLIAQPAPNGVIPIGVETVKGKQKDNLQQLLQTLGFDFLASNPVKVEEIRNELNADGSNTV